MKNTLKSNMFFMILILIQILSVVTLGPVIKRSGMPSYTILLITEYGLIFLPSIIFLIMKKQPLRESMRLNPIGIKSILIIVLIGIFLYPIAIFIGLLSQLFFRNLLSDAVQTLSSLPLWGNIFILAITPAICEETAMRGAVLSGYKNVNIKKAAIMNGFLFGIFHMNPQQFFYAFALGVVFVYLVEITNSIFSSMICHFVCNGLSFTISYFAMKSMNNLNMKTALPNRQILLAGAAVWFVIALVSLVVVIFLIKLLAGLNNNTMKMQEMQIGYKEDRVGSSEEKVLNWPIYATIAIYIGFIILAQTVLNIKMFN